MKNKKPRIEYDKTNDLIYITLGIGKVIKTLPFDGDVMIDFNKHGVVVGIEVLNFSLRFQ